MSSARNFRVTINLSNFFHDHRNRARIFINDDVQTIQDLEERIEKIFNIKNIHLTSQNEYLPPTEDVRILQKDDIIWVMQNSDEQIKIVKSTTDILTNDKKNVIRSKKRSISVSGNTNEDENADEDIHPPKRKKKKRFDFEKDKEESSQCATTNEILKKKKKKLKQVNEDCTKTGQAASNMEVEQVVPKRKKMKQKLKSSSSESKISNSVQEDTSNQSKDGTININTLLPVLHSHISSYNKKVTKSLNKTESSAINVLEKSLSPSATMKQNDSQSESVNSTRDTYKGSLSYKKKVLVPLITDKYLQEKKINIVKIEYLSGGPAEIKGCELVKTNGGTEREDKSSFTNSNPKISENCINKSSTFENEQNSINRDKPITSNINQYELVCENSIRIPSSKDNVANENISASVCENDDSHAITLDSNQYTTETNGDGNSMERYCNKIKMPQNNHKDLNKSIGEMETVNTTTKVIEPLFISADEKLKPMQLAGVGDLSKTSTGIMDSIISMSPSGDSEVDELNCSLKETSTSNPNEALRRSTNKNDLQNNGKMEEITDSKEEFLSGKTMSSERTVKEISKLFSETDSYFTEQNKTCQTALSDTVLELSNNCNEASPFSEKDEIAKKEQMSVTKKVESNVSQSPHSSQNEMEKQNLGKSASTPIDKTNEVLEYIRNFFEQRVNKDIPSSSSLSPKKELTNLTLTDSSINLCDSIKDSEMDLTKDVASNLELDRLSSASSNCGNSSIFSKRKQLSGIGQLLEELRSNESLVTGESLDSDHIEFVTKRQRKRVRKRRKKNDKQSSNTSLNDSSIVEASNYVPKPLKTKACPTIHLKFEEEDGELLKAVDVSKKESLSPKENESYIETLCVENITIESDLDESNMGNFSIKEEHILKSPSIKNLLPKIGEIIAFKILRITENYTPEISSYIIGKVIQFNTDNKTVLYDILSGIEQCEVPKGRLSLEGTSENIDSKNNKREFTWSEVIDPRLLFP